MIHAEPRIAWQRRRAEFFAEGFRRAGIPWRITSDRFRQERGVPVLLGTTCWREVEASGPYLLVDRCSFGDTDTFVSLVWNGHGRRGDHRVPATVPAWRWERYGVPVAPWRREGARVVLCGQTESYSPQWTLERWYAAAGAAATHFRPHPAGANPTALPEARSFEDCRLAVTLNSSVAVQAVLAGVPTVTMDGGAMAWDVTGHHPDDVRTPEREPWCHWLAWTQWSDDEIRRGDPWAYHW